MTFHSQIELYELFVQEFVRTQKDLPNQLEDLRIIELNKEVMSAVRDAKMIGLYVNPESAIISALLTGFYFRDWLEKQTITTKELERISQL